jgi:3-oxoacyl-[acyl-carrier-protein] synthase-3
MSRRPHAQVVGWGRYLPRRVLTNEDLSEMVDTSDQWIRERTGISERRIADEDETTATMATRAAEAAMEMAAADPLEIDLIIVATATPDYPFPATACLVQRSIGADHAGAFDLEAGCSGFIYALAMATNAIESGACHQVLIIGSETLSRITNWKDRDTCVLFGDGAGALLLRQGNGPGGVLSTALGADGTGAEWLILPGGGSRNPASAETVAEGLHTIQMDGRKVFRFATKSIPAATRKLVQQAGIQLKDVDLLIGHQANLRILQSAAERLELPMEKVFVNIERYGNTSAASIPIALCDAVEEGKLLPSHRVVLVGFGAGLTWAAALLQWAAKPEVKRDKRWILAAFRRFWARVVHRLRHWFTLSPDPHSQHVS